MGFGGIIGRLKSVFAKEPEIVEEVAFKDIEGWLNKKYSSKEDFLKGELEGAREKVNQEILLAKQNIEALKLTGLRNDNIPEKAKHYMEGNREIYIRKALLFFESLEMPTDARTAAAFASEFDSKINEFGKSTTRAYAIMREFVEQEVSKLAANIKNIDNVAAEIKASLADSRIKEMDKLKEGLIKINDLIARKEMLLDEADKKDELAKNLSTDKSKLFREIHDIENSQEFKDCQMLKVKFEEAKKLSAQKGAELAHLFSSLERPLKKYERIAFADQDLIKKYIESPISALSQDFGFRIVGILGNMKKAILDNTIELKDKQKIKASEDIRQLDKQYLSKFMAEYAQLKKKENDFIIEIRKLKIAENLARLKEDLKVKSSMFEKAKKDADGLHSEIGKIDIEILKKELVESIKSTMNINLVLS